MLPSRSRAAAAAAVDRELGALDGEAGAGQRLADKRGEIAAADNQRLPAPQADRLVVARELADEAVVAVGPVDADQPALLAHPEQEAVDRGAAAGGQGRIELGHHVLGGE